MAATNGMVYRVFDGCPIRTRKADAYMDATAMCKANNKRLNNYMRSAETEAFLAELSAVTRISATELVQVRQGGSPTEQGTWVHHRVAMNLAQWCSPKFAVAVTGWVWELLTTGKVELGSPNDKPPPGCDWSDVVRVLADGQRELVDVLLRVERAVLTPQEAVSNVPFLLELMSGQRSMTAAIQQVMEVAVLAKEAAEDASKHACTALRITQGHMKPDRKPSREAIRNKVKAELKLDPNRSNAEIVRVLWDEYQMPITGPTVGRIRRKMTESRFTLPDLYPGSGNG